MASNLFGRYVWLIDTLRRYKRLTYEEINQLWQQSRLSYGEGDELPIRTFHNHRNAIFDIFDVEIRCDTKDCYKYYIDNPERLEGDGLRGWLIDSYSMLNQIQSDHKLEGRILFEEIPSGHIWLMTMTNAIRQNRVLTITHQGFAKSEANTFEIEPYYLKVVKRRWYVIARSPYYSDRNTRKNEVDGGDRTTDVFLVYALDRISDIQETDKTFTMDESFSIEEYFKGCCGIITSDEEPIKVIIKAYYNGPDYLRTLPLHESQIELKTREEDEACYFQYEICPTFDFYQTLLAQADQIEVIEPECVRKEMRNFAKSLMNFYNK